VTHQKHIGGLLGVATVSFGQFVSIIGSNMTGIGFSIWAFQVTGRATALALIGIGYFLPQILLSPLAGVLVDRWSRKRVMILSDTVPALFTVGLIFLYRADALQVWHVFIAVAGIGACNAFQGPAFESSISLMVSKEQYARANGFVAMARNGSGIFGPMLAGALYGFIGLGGILAVDIATFFFAAATLLLVRIPRPAPTAAGSSAAGASLLRQSLFGIRYIFNQPSLRALMSVYFVAIVALNFSAVVLNPMILARTGNNSLLFGSFQTAASIGAVVGGALLAAWGGPKRNRVGRLLVFISLIGVGYMVMGAGRGFIGWAIGGCAAAFFVAMTGGINQSIWQSKVPADIQGRVMAARFALSNWGRPIIMVIAGPLADYVLEPAMQVSGPFSRIFGPIVGTGTGTGMAAMLFISALAVAVVGFAGFGSRALRRIDELLPDLDHEAVG
jgi:DHA3 family macrolide efflux protein-like MFS transporter